jgi:hypothetical protein
MLCGSIRISTDEEEDGWEWEWEWELMGIRWTDKTQVKTGTWEWTRRRTMCRGNPPFEMKMEIKTKMEMEETRRRRRRRRRLLLRFGRTGSSMRTL